MKRRRISSMKFLLRRQTISGTNLPLEPRAKKELLNKMLKRRRTSSLPKRHSSKKSLMKKSKRKLN
jgi:hypothetical protein